MSYDSKNLPIEIAHSKIIKDQDLGTGFVGQSGT